MSKFQPCLLQQKKPQFVFGDGKCLYHTASAGMYGIELAGNVELSPVSRNTAPAVPAQNIGIITIKKVYVTMQPEVVINQSAAGALGHH